MAAFYTPRQRSQIRPASDYPCLAWIATGTRGSFLNACAATDTAEPWAPTSYSVHHYLTAAYPRYWLNDCPTSLARRLTERPRLYVADRGGPTSEPDRTLRRFGQVSGGVRARVRGVVSVRSSSAGVPCTPGSVRQV